MEENLDSPSPNKTSSRTEKLENSVQPSQGIPRGSPASRLSREQKKSIRLVTNAWTLDKGESGLVGKRSGNHPKLACYNYNYNTKTFRSTIVRNKKGFCRGEIKIVRGGRKLGEGGGGRSYIRGGRGGGGGGGGKT